MNVALPALVVFALLLPGFIFRHGLKIVERDTLDYSPFGRVVTEAILWAGLLHAVWLFASGWIGYTFLPGVFFGLLSSNQQQNAEAIKAVANTFGPIAGYLISMYLVALLIPPWLRARISHYRLDRYGHPLSRFLRFHKAPWYYLLTDADFPPGEAPDYIQVAALVPVGGKVFLYKGVLDEFFVDGDGALDRLVLSLAQRRPIEDDKGQALGIAADMPSPSSRFYPIDGDYFVLRYSDAITLNVTYISVVEEPAVGSAAGSSTAQAVGNALTTPPG